MVVDGDQGDASTRNLLKPYVYCGVNARQTLRQKRDAGKTAETPGMEALTSYQGARMHQKK